MQLKNTSPPREPVPLLAKVYLRLGTWKRALFPGLDDESIRGNEMNYTVPEVSCIIFCKPMNDVSIT
jgi:hypothetical protein